MKLEHSFTVPADLDTVWQAVLDPERVAPCMPGATLTEVDGDAFKGSVKVKMGPISLLYKGTGEFLSKDADTSTVVIKAAGKDARGNGTASATVTVTLTAAGDSTVGSVSTDLSITGKPAQFGRGLISEVGGKILDTFATCLASKLAPAAAPEPPKLSVVTDPPTAEPAEPEAAEDEAASTTPRHTEATESAQPTKAGKAEKAGKSAQPAEAGRAAQLAEAGKVGKSAQLAEAGKMGKSAQPAEASKSVQPAKAGKSAQAAEARETAQHAEARETGKQAGEATAAHAPAAAKAKLAAAPEPEPEPIDLLAYAGPSVLKRVAPLIALVAAVLTFIALRRRR